LFEEVHVRVVEAPTAIDAAANVNTGAGGITAGVCVAAASACKNPKPDAKFGEVGDIASVDARKMS
jgi:hypothetical protein